MTKEASFGGDFGGGYGGGYGGGNGGYGGQNYCPSRCVNSILQAKKCKAWFYDCNRYYDWCGGGGGGVSFINIRSPTVTRPFQPFCIQTDSLFPIYSGI